VVSEDGRSQTVLEVGAGGITVCEVHIYSGPGYGLIVEPCSDDEVRTHVMDFAEYIWRAAKGNAVSTDDDDESQGVSKEIERAIRNLSGLGVRNSLLVANFLRTWSRFLRAFSRLFSG